jgi:hypothetical protein
MLGIIEFGAFSLVGGGRNDQRRRECRAKIAQF